MSRRPAGLLAKALPALLASCLVAAGAAAQACTPRNFLLEPLPATLTAPHWRAAILLAYPVLELNDGADTLRNPDGIVLGALDPTDRPPRVRLETPTVGDQFVPGYPLSRDLESRTEPFFDPGRVRNEEFFALLYGSDPATVEAELEIVSFGPARFRVTSRHGAACQLRGAFGLMKPHQEAVLPFFENAGGGYAWRRIAGTDRTSPHSWGIAIDLNAELGGYWRWTGANEGAVGAYRNRIPWPLVEAMESSGFVWGGKWHHFDGMHFEYRPELILYGRMLQGN